MTDQPPGPPPGNYPPPSSGGGGYPPPGGYPQSGFPQNGFPQNGFPQNGFPQYGFPPGGAVGAFPTGAYTPWLSRFLAFLIDYIPYLVIIGIGWGILMGTQECVDFSDTGLGEILGESYNARACSTSTIGQGSVTFAGLVGLAYVLWNYGYRQGTTGSSIGKSILKFKVISERTGQPLGFGLSLVRQLAHVVDSIICGVGFLFPLWDNKRQTLADKIMTTVCLPT